MSIKSPFNGLHTDLKANFADYCGWLLPADYGDSEMECRRLYEHCAAFDLSAFGRITVGGDDAQSVISYLLASGAENLEDGRWIWGVIADENGGIIDIVRAAQSGNSFLLLTSPTARLNVEARIGECARQCGAADVKIHDQTEKTGMLGIYGPNAVEAFDHIVPLGAGQLPEQGIKNLSLFMMSITVIKGSWLGVGGIEIFGGATACKLAAGAIEKYHKREHIAPAGMECLETAATESSLPLIITGQKLPQKFNWPRMAAKKESGRVLVGIKSDGKAHTHKDLKVQYDGLEIGWTDRIVWSGRFEKTIGLAMVNSEMGSLDEAVQITGDGVALGAEIVPLPFDAEIAAGIYRN